MTDRFVLRVPCAPQYANYELHLEFDSYDELDKKIETLHHGLMVKLGVLSVNAALLAKADPANLPKMDEWDSVRGPIIKPEEPPEFPGKTEVEAANRGGLAAPEAIEDAYESGLKRALGATMLAEYKTVAPWDGPPAKDDRPAPPWAAPPTPAPAASGGLNLDDF